MSKRFAGLVTAAVMALLVAVVPSVVPERAGAAPAPSLSSAAVAADGHLIASVKPSSETSSAKSSDDGGSPLGLLLVATVCIGLGVLALATHQPRLLSRRRRT